MDNDLSSLVDIFPWLEWFSLFYLSITVMIFHIDRNFSTLEASLRIKNSQNKKVVATNRNISYCRMHANDSLKFFLLSTNKSFLIIFLVRSQLEVIYVLFRKSDKLHTPPGCIFARTYIWIHIFWYCFIIGYRIKSKVQKTSAEVFGAKYTQ